MAKIIEQTWSVVTCPLVLDTGLAGQRCNIILVAYMLCKCGYTKIPLYMAYFCQHFGLPHGAAGLYG